MRPLGLNEKVGGGRSIALTHFVQIIPRLILSELNVGDSIVLLLQEYLAADSSPAGRQVPSTKLTFKTIWNYCQCFNFNVFDEKVSVNGHLKIGRIAPVQTCACVRHEAFHSRNAYETL